jgi:predicted RND superfamily exporter protein
VRAALRKVTDPAFTVHLTGPVVAETLLGEQILADLARLVPLVVAVVGVVLYVCLGQVVAAMTVLVGMLVVLVWTFGAMALLGVPLTLVTSVLPVLLMAMAVNDQIHLLERVQRHLSGGGSIADALGRAFAEVGRPIVRTAVTTSIGFLAFTTTSVLPMRHFGVFAALGLLLAMAFTFTLLPALLMVLGLKPRRDRAAREEAPRGIERWAARRPRVAVLAAAGAVLVASLAGLPALRIEDSWVENFDRRSDLAVAAKRFDRDYLGGYRLDLTLDRGEPGAFRLPEGVRLVDSVQTVLASFPEVSGTRSVVDLARAGLAGVAPERSLETLSAAGLAQLFLVLEMSGSQEPLNRLVAGDGGAARIQCFVRGADYSRARRLLGRVDELGRALASRGVRMRASGDLAVATEVVRATVLNQVRSVGATLIGLAVVMALVFRSLAAAALIAPVAATTLVMFGGMGVAGIPLGVATSMFAALAEGEGAGFAIHLASRWFDLRREHDPGVALSRTLGGVGATIRWNGLIVVAGCLVLCFSELRPVRALGGLIAAGIAVSYLMSFLVLPALLPRLPIAAARRRGIAPGAALLAVATKTVN